MLTSSKSNTGYENKKQMSHCAENPLNTHTRDFPGEIFLPTFFPLLMFTFGDKTAALRPEGTKLEPFPRPKS